MSKNFLRFFTVTGTSLAVTAAAVCAGFYGLPSALGVAAGAVWAYLNLFFMMRLVETAMSGVPSGVSRSRRIVLVSVLKFPVLYLAGYFMLQSRVLPIYSVLTGLSAYFMAFAAAWFFVGYSVLTAQERSS